MITYNPFTKQLENRDMRKAENRKSNQLGFTVLNADKLSDLEKQYVENHIMFVDFKKVPKDFVFHALSNNKIKGIYKGIPVIIEENNDYVNRTVSVKIQEFTSDEECTEKFYGK